MIIRILASVTIFLLTGCGILGAHMNSPPCWDAQVNKSIDFWTHPEKSIEEQMRDWISCGGNREYGGTEVHPLPFGVEMSESYDSRIHPSKRWNQQVKCMLYMGYHYAGICISDSLVCHEARLDKYPLLGTRD